MSKKICILYGNCFVEWFMQLLQPHAQFNEEYEIVSNVVHKHKPIIDQEYLSKCELFIYQRGSLQYPPFYDQISSHSLNISFPIAITLSLFPFHSKGGMENALLRQLKDQNLTNEEIFERYKNFKVNDNFDLQKIFKTDQQRMQFNDDNCDIKLKDFIPQSLHEKPYWVTYNHLHLDYLTYILNSILERIHMAPILDHSYIPSQVMLPINPQIAEYFDLKWVTEKSTYFHISQKWLTHDQYIMKCIQDMV